MKKSLLLMLMALLMSVSTWSQTEVTIGSNNYSENQDVPHNLFYLYGASQTIYLSSEITSTGYISAISFRNTDATVSTTRSIKVYMATTSLSSFASRQDALPANDFTLVYDGTWSVVGGQWSQITLDTPFQYEGTNNLVIGIEDYTNSYHAAGTWQSTSGTGRSLSDSYDYSPIVLSDLTVSTVNNFYPDVKLSISAQAPCTRVASLTSSNITSSSATFSWPERNGATFYYSYKKASANSWSNDESTSDANVTIENLDANTTYKFRVKVDCGNNEQSLYREISFTTPCESITNLPWVRNFEDNTSGSLPNCWNVINPYATSYPQVTSMQYYAHGGQNSIEFRAGSNNSFAVLPAFETRLDSLQISFYTRREDGLSGIFSVGYIKDIADTTTFVAMQSITAADIGDNDYHLYEVSFSGITIEEGTLPRIAFAYRSTGSNRYWFVDDVTVNTVQECSRPGQIAVTPASTSATINWTSTGEDFVVHYKSSTDEEYTIISEVTSSENNHSVTLSDLTPATEYTYYVSVICSEGDSLHSEVSTFVTECAALTTVPHTWGFEESADSDTGLPPCWAKTLNSFYSGAYLSENAAVDGYQSLYMTGTSNITILPVIDWETLPISTLQLRFQAKRGSDATNLEVGVITDINNAATSFVSLASFNLSSSFEEKTAMFSSYTTEASTGTRIALRLTGDYPYCYVDNMVL
ncbi:MAG: fibronectin type III domain-containing protein [Bacteroidota bacterium]|nr:fibronectin type III domain-containing protein [Bacteroidota bacterium]